MMTTHKSKNKYIADVGDLVWLDFNKTQGHEQKGRRPGLVITGKEFNKETGLAFICPVTSKDKNYPFHVSFVSQKISGLVMVDQLSSLGINARNVEFVGKLDKPTLIEVKEILHAIFR